MLKFSILMISSSIANIGSLRCCLSIFSHQPLNFNCYILDKHCNTVVAHTCTNESCDVYKHSELNNINTFQIWHSGQERFRFKSGHAVRIAELIKERLAYSVTVRISA